MERWALARREEHGVRARLDSATRVGSAASPSDEELVARVRAGEVHLYEVIIRRHNQRLYRAARAILRDDGEVEDVLQEAYLAAYRSLSSFEQRARFSSWLTRIVVNRALDRRRARGREFAPTPLVDEAGGRRDAAPGWHRASEDPERQTARHELASLLESAIDELPAAYRAVYLLREVEGLDTMETAASLGIAINTVKTRLHRARGLLRERLRRDLDGVAADAFPFGATRCDRLVAGVLAQLHGRND